MASEQETLIYVEANDKAEAGALAKGFARTSVKNRAYINALGVELGLKYLASEGINISNLHNLHSVHKFLEEFDIADIMLPNIHIDVRVVFSDKYIFVPKSHFEFGLTPDIYLVFQLADDHSYVKALGFFKPELINKKDANKDYYFIQKEKLTPISNLKTFIEHASNNTAQNLDEDTIFLSEARFVSMIDNDLHDEEKRDLIGTLLKSDELRDRLIEFSNFEILSYKAANDSDIQQPASTEPDADLTPAAAAAALEAADIFIETAADAAEEPETKNIEPPIDEFEIFENSHDEFDGNAQEEDINNIDDVVSVEPETADVQEDVLHIDNAEPVQTEDVLPDAAEDTTTMATPEELTSAEDISFLEEPAPLHIEETDTTESQNEDEPSFEIIEQQEEDSAPAEENKSNETVDLLFNDNFTGENIDSDDDIEFIDTQPEMEDSDKDMMLGYTTPPETNSEEQELINFDDIDVSMSENFENYKREEYSANDAVAFDVLEPVSLNVDLNDSSNEGNFIAALSGEVEISPELNQLPEIKTDIIDENITGIGAIDTLGLIEEAPEQNTANDTAADEGGLKFDLLDSQSDEIKAEDNEVSQDIDELPTIDTIDSFENLNIEETLKPINEDVEFLTDINQETPAAGEIEELSADNIEELSSTENSTDEFLNLTDPEPIEGSISELNEDLPVLQQEPADEIDNLSTELDTLTELGDNTQSSDEFGDVENIEPIESLDSLNFESDIKPEAAEMTVEENAVTNEPETLNFDEITPLSDDMPEVLPELTGDIIQEANNEIKTDELLNFAPEELPPLEEEPAQEPIAEVKTDEMLNFAPEELPSLEEEPAQEPIAEAKTDELLSFAPEELPPLEEEPAQEPIAEIKTDELLNFAPEELPSLEEEPAQEPIAEIKTDEMLNFAPEELPPLEEEPAKEPIAEAKTDELLSFAPEELPPLEEAPATVENKDENSSELLSFADVPEPTAEEQETDDSPFALIDDAAEAPKPMDVEQATLNFDSPSPKDNKSLTEEVADLTDMPAELDSKNILAEIDTLLGAEQIDDDDDDDTDNDDKDFIEPKLGIMPDTESQTLPEDGELTPEETIYMQTMAKEKGKKGMTLLLIVVAALMSVLTLTTFIKNASSNNNGIPMPAEGEIIDNLSNPPATLPTEPEPSAQSTPPVQVQKEPQTPEKIAAAAAKSNAVKKVEAPAQTDTVVKGHFYPEIKKITFEIPDYLSYSEGIRKYLQSVGRSVKLSATSDLLLTTDYSTTDRVKIALTLTPDGNIRKSEMAISSGSKQIDQIVLQSVKNTLDVVKPPADEVKGDELKMAIILNF